MARPHWWLSILSTAPSLHAQRVGWPLTQKKWRSMKGFLGGSEVIRFRFRKMELAASGEWVGGGVKETGRPWEAVPVFWR